MIDNFNISNCKITSYCDFKHYASYGFAMPPLFI